MIDKMFEQAQNSFKPMNELMALNTKAMEQMAEKQKNFVNGMVTDGMNFAKELGAQKDLSGIYQAQKTYWEGVQAKLVSASTEAYELFTSTQEKAGDVIRSASTPAQ